MMSRYTAMCRFVLIERDMCGDEVSSVTAHDQHLQFITTIKKTTNIEVAECTALLEQLNVDTPAFSHDQRRAIACALSAVMKHSPASVSTQSDKRQTHMYSFNYYPQNVWTELLDPATSFDDKLDVIATFLISIGCVNPSEPSRASMIATVCIASKSKLMPEQEYAYVHQLGDIFMTKRTVSRAKPSMHVFPQLVEDFVAVYDTVYTADQPPTAAPINIAKIRELQSIVPTRSSNKRLWNKKQHNNTKSSGSVEDSSEGKTMRMMMQYMMNGLSRQAPSRRAPSVGAEDDADEDAPWLSMCPPPRRGALVDAAPPPAPSVSAPSGAASLLPDNQLPGCMQKVRAGCASVLPSDKDSIDDMAAKVKAALTNQAAKHDDKKVKKGKRLKLAAIAASAAIDSEDDDSDEESDDVPAAHVGSSMKTTHKKPAAAIAMKVPPKLTGKKVAPVAAAVAPPVKPALALTPTLYNGGKIYFAKTKSKHGTFRCYVRCGDKVETTISITDNNLKGKQRAWLACLAAIDNDLRPRA